MTGYSADLERLDAGARELNGFAGQAGEIAGSLDRRWPRSAPAGATTRSGGVSPASHESPPADASGVSTGLATVLGDVGDKLAATAETYRHVEAEQRVLG